MCVLGSETRLVGRLMIVSGKTGRVLRWMQVPDDRESYYSPQILTHPDGIHVTNYYYRYCSETQLSFSMSYIIDLTFISGII